MILIMVMRRTKQRHRAIIRSNQQKGFEMLQEEIHEQSISTFPWLSLADPNLETDTGWIDMQGNFYPCEYGGHSDLLNSLQERGMLNTFSMNEAENQLVKFSGGDIYSYAKALSPRARLTMETLIEKHNILSGRTEPCLVANYEFWNENGKARSRRA